LYGDGSGFNYDNYYSYSGRLNSFYGNYFDPYWRDPYYMYGYPYPSYGLGLSYSFGFGFGLGFGLVVKTKSKLLSFVISSTNKNPIENIFYWHGYCRKLKQ